MGQLHVWSSHMTTYTNKFDVRVYTQCPPKIYTRITKMFQQLRPQNFPNALVLQPQMESNKATRLFGAYLSPVVVSDQGHPES
jgi:hypothetical protein